MNDEMVWQWLLANMPDWGAGFRLTASKDNRFFRILLAVSWVRSVRRGPPKPPSYSSFGRVPLFMTAVQIVQR